MKRIVIKIGTTSLVDPATMHMRSGVVAQIAREITRVRDLGTQVALVSSGAIAAGKYRMQSVGPHPQYAFSKPAYAGIGSRHILNLWGNAFERHWYDVAQVWVTHANWSTPHEYSSIRKSLVSYLESSCIIPLVNENDVVSDKEIVLMERGISENDQLAGMVAHMIGADGILFVTSQGGVYDRNPDLNPDAVLLPHLNRSTAARIDTVPVDSSTTSGTGGMAAKLNEAFKCAESGMHVAIAGIEEGTIERFVRGEDVGTRIEYACSVA